MNSIIHESHSHPLELETFQQNGNIIEKNLNSSLPPIQNNGEMEAKSSLNSKTNYKMNFNNSDTRIDIVPPTSLNERSAIDNRHDKQINYYTSTKIAEGMMDISLLTANANQLRFLFTYNYDSRTYYLNFVLIITSLILQIGVGIALIFKRQMKNRGKFNEAYISREFLIVGVFLVTIINVFIAAFTTTEPAKN